MREQSPILVSSKGKWFQEIKPKGKWPPAKYQKAIGSVPAQVVPKGQGLAAVFDELQPQFQSVSASVNYFEGPNSNYSKCQWLQAAVSVQ